MALRLFTLLLMLWVTSAAAGEKQLSSFNAISGLDYYSATGGSVTATIDTAILKEGTGALRLDYSLAAGTGSFVEYLRNFGLSTQDYNFSPDKLTLWIKGNGSSDKFKFQLYEDNNLNGTFEEGGEEVWQWSHSTILSNTGWNKVSIPFANFSKIAGSGGNGALDLARIGKWRIRIDSPTGAAHATSSVWVDDLRLVNTYTLPTTTRASDGQIVQIWNDTGCACGNWTQAQWNSELQRMAGLGMTTFIVQYGMWDNGSGTVTSFYPSSLPFVTYNQSTLDYIMAAAQSTGMKVVVGLYFNANWDGDLDFDAPATYSAVDTRNAQVIDEIWNRYGTNPAFGGWYIPQEIDDLRWQSATRRGMLAGMVQNMAARAKSKSPALPVMISPFFGMNQPADVYRDWWIGFLATASSVDWVIPQDGVGTNRTDGDTDVPYYFAAIKTAAEGAGRNFGATVETFQQTSPTTFAPAPSARVDEQRKVAGALANRIFEWSSMAGAPAQPVVSASPIYGDTLDNAAFGNYTTVMQGSQTAQGFGRTLTHRIVIDPQTTTADYAPAINALAPVSQIMLQPADSTEFKTLDPTTFGNRVQSYISAFPGKLYMIEVGNEINGEWLGTNVVAKVQAAYDKTKAAGLPAVLTAYYNPNCWSNASNEMLPWLQNNIPAAMKAGLDYVLISYYEGDCNNHRVTQAEADSVFTQLHTMFPNARLGFGEVGLANPATSTTMTKAQGILTYYYGLVPSCGGCTYVRGGFWWYGQEDLYPTTTKPLWTTFKNAILAY